MANLSDFFPASGGGSGGFTKRLKYTTARGLDDADYNNAASYTVNPATDLGLEDGAQIGYMLVGAGYTGNTSGGGYGGKIIHGTAAIVTASTDLVLTPGIANGGSSTISGGLTLTSANGSNAAGFGDFNQSNVVCLAAGIGIMGYGAGGGTYNTGKRNQGVSNHGYGVGGFQDNGAGDGAILLYY